jgi:hypothetical protein
MQLSSRSWVAWEAPECPASASLDSLFAREPGSLFRLRLLPPAKNAFREGVESDHGGAPTLLPVGALSF